MGEIALRVTFYVVVCLAAGLVHGATRASTPAAILRHGLREFLKLAGGIAILCGAIWLLLRVVQD